MELQVREKTMRNEELKKRLLELQRHQRIVAARLEEAKEKKGELTGLLKQKTQDKLTLRQECNKLRPYTLQSSTALQGNLTELREILNNDKARIDALDRRARALQTSTDSFAAVATDVVSCIKILDEIATELAKEEDELVRNAKQRDALSERGKNAREVEQAEVMLRRQLSKWTDRSKRIRDQSNEKAEEAKEKMQDLQAIHRKLTAEHAKKGKEMEIRRVRIEQIEKKVSSTQLLNVIRGN
jgi:kinetochore protein Nuf2